MKDQHTVREILRRHEQAPKHGQCSTCSRYVICTTARCRLLPTLARSHCAVSTRKIVIECTSSDESDRRSSPGGDWGEMIKCSASSSLGLVWVCGRIAEKRKPLCRGQRFL